MRWSTENQQEENLKPKQNINKLYKYIFCGKANKTCQ